MELQIQTKEFKVKQCNYGNTRKINVFCNELANTYPRKEFKVFFAFAESPPTSATLPPHHHRRHCHYHH